MSPSAGTRDIPSDHVGRGDLLLLAIAAGYVLVFYAAREVREIFFTDH